MKRLTKKYLMLLIAIVAFMAVTMFAASAAVDPATCKHALYPSYEGSVINPTCTDDGYTQVVCGNCNTVVGRVPGSEVAAKGHKYKWTMVSAGSDYYNNGECQVCHLNVKERDEDGNIVVYYAVEFKNPAAVKAYDTAITYTSVVSERVGLEGAKLLGTVYVKAGEKVKADDLRTEVTNAICEKDAEYGAYNFIGWYNQYILIGSDKKLDDVKGLIKYDFEGLEINSNMAVYAGFQGEDITYDVRFYNWNGTALAVGKRVPHGKAVVYSLDLPTKEADVKYRYTFNYWSYEGKEVNLGAIYADVSLTAVFVPVARSYNVAYYYDAACTQPIIDKDRAVVDSKVKYGEAAVNGLAIPAELLVKEQDDQYVYAWTGRWVMANRPEYKVSLSSFTVPNGTPDALDGSAEVRLIPEYVKNPRVYELKITVLYPPNPVGEQNYHPEDVYIQVLYANGQIADARPATRIDEYTYELVSLVNYSPSYTIAATSTGYEGTGVSHFIAGPSGAIITLEKIPAHSCGCICHTFLKPIWVRILNLLYTLFGTEHVCCNDMFANIGANLKYGPGKN